MKPVFVLFIFSIFFLSKITTAQNLITFDNQGWNSDQSLDSKFRTGNFMFSGNKNILPNLVKIFKAKKF